MTVEMFDQAMTGERAAELRAALLKVDNVLREVFGDASYVITGIRPEINVGFVGEKIQMEIVDNALIAYIFGADGKLSSEGFSEMWSRASYGDMRRELCRN